ncbi:MAG: hypothetical protein V3V13_01870 [Paracoccaceae bacterium]
MAKYTHTKISGPVKSFIEGTGGFFAVVTIILIVGAFASGALIEGLIVAIIPGVISAAIYGIASLIPAKNQYNEK